MFRRLSPALIVVPVAVLACAQPAAALPVPPGTNICATGTLEAGERPPADPGRTPLVVRIQPCAGTPAEDLAAGRWGLAEYDQRGGHIRSSTLRPFDGPGVTQYLAPGYRDGNDQADGSLGGVRAVCLVAGLTYNRVACVRTELDPDHRVVITPLPADNPLVSLPVSPGHPGGNDPNPECGACV
ncbi:hypothetical protein [Actinoplanes sp. NPDC049265]|uniref:hypothetical protein n=1 Tax=Actinoplanes sp. NPDC049265 TaxID=3363902 RepID=UPI00371A868C